MTNAVAWIESTAIHRFLVDNYETVLPTIQSVHIVAIGVVIGSLLIITLRILGWAGLDLTLVQTNRRFGPWIWSGLVVLAATGVLMILTEPAREFLDPRRSTAADEHWNYAFWIKMALIVVGIVIAAAFQRHVKRNQDRWEQSILVAPRTQVLAVLTFLGWLTILVMGRLIAFPSVLNGV